LRRGSSVLIGGAFEWLFCPDGREFEQANLQKFKCPAHKKEAPTPPLASQNLLLLLTTAEL